jgi:tRNA-Thr(GGU) m(6)t(6)A37 methyltransferase TsaA
MDNQKIEITPIAHIETDFGTKFGIPRQAGLVQELKGKIVFDPAFRSADALRGIENYSHLWLIWQFSENIRSDWSPTVRPPRLGGNTRVGVFATRSPFRPNALGLSCVRLEAVETDRQYGTVLLVSGADLMNGTPIFDIKPYIPYADCIPEASEGFAPKPEEKLEVCFEAGTDSAVPDEKLEALKAVLRCDPRPRYQNDPERIYGMEFAGLDVHFHVDGNKLTVTEVR